MTAVVVLGMHRSGTSLVASMLEAMGVHMGDRLLPPSENNPRGYFEDLDFYNLNRAILHDAGGDWANPPSVRAISEAGERVKHEIAKVVAEKQAGGLWGWKDPRTCLTVPLYHHLLDDVRYVVVKRDSPDVSRSLTKRNGPGNWAGLHRIYTQRLEAFLANVDAPVLRLRYEDLTHPLASVPPHA